MSAAVWRYCGSPKSPRAAPARPPAATSSAASTTPLRTRQPLSDERRERPERCERLPDPEREHDRVAAPVVHDRDVEDDRHAPARERDRARYAVGAHVLRHVREPDAGGDGD